MGPIFLFLIVGGILFGAAAGRLDVVTVESLTAAKDAVELAIGLVGAMALFLGLAEVLRDAGLTASIARALRPVFRRLFADVPDDHPAIGLMSLNIAANVLGLGNAATPFGIAAMRQLDRLNGDKGTATNAMCMFLALNTSGVAVFATGVVSARVSLGSSDPASILVSSPLATGFSTIVGVSTVLLLSRLRTFRRSRPPAVVEAEPHGPDGDDPGPPPAAPPWRPLRTATAAALGLTAFGFARTSEASGAAEWIDTLLSSLPMTYLVLLIVLYGWSRGVPVYDSVVRGAKQGFEVALLIIPYLVAILVAVALFRASGALDVILAGIAPLVEPLGFPREALPVALVRPLSGSGAYAVMNEVMAAEGPDSFVGYLVSTLYGSTETTFYVLAVYGGAVGLRRTRHALPACLSADLAGIVGATVVCRFLFG
jgi:spore maturation protein SpmA